LSNFKDYNLYAYTLENHSEDEKSCHQKDKSLHEFKELGNENVAKFL